MSHFPTIDGGTESLRADVRAAAEADAALAAARDRIFERHRAPYPAPNAVPRDGAAR